MILVPAGRFEWEKLIRRARLEPTEKLIALLLATYADPDGTRVRPGIPRLVNVSGKSRATVCRAISALRENEFLEYTFRGSRSGKRDLADEYRLTYPSDPTLFALDPDERPRLTHEMWSDPRYPQPGLTHDTCQANGTSHFEADQVSPMSKPGLTHETPPHHHQPQHQPHSSTVITPSVEGSALSTGQDRIDDWAGLPIGRAAASIHREH